MALARQRVLQRAHDQPAHQPGIAETHFGLGGMHIHVHEGRIASTNSASAGWRSRARKSA